MNDRARTGRLLVALAVTVGIVASTVLVQIHLTPHSGLCGGGETFNCSGAAQSRWAAVFGIPIALLGLAFYGSALLVVVRWWAANAADLVGGGRILVTLFAGAVVYSLFLAVVSVVDVGSICPWCAALYGANLLGLVGSVQWAGSPVSAIRAQLGSADRLFAEGGALVSGTFVAIVVAGLVVISQVEPADAVDEGPAVSAEILYDEGSASWGNPDAPVRLVEFSDFQCPYCSSLADTVDAMKAEFSVDELRVEFRHNPLPFHADARGAAIAAVCADEQGLFWDLHDHMFAHQDELGRAELLAFVRTTAMDAGAFEACLDSPQAAARVDADLAAGRELGVTGTPTFFLNEDRITGSRSPGELRRMIRARLDASAADQAP